MESGFHIGVVIACYRGERYLPATLRSLQEQEHRAWQAVVVDDGSPDDVAGVAESFAVNDDRITLVRIPNGGVCAARNTGFRRLPETVRYVMFLDQDDVLKPEALSTLAAVLEAHAQAGLAHCEPQLIDAEGRDRPGSGWMPRWAQGKGWPQELPASADGITPFESIYCAAGVLPSLSLYRRSVLARTALYDVELGQCYEDVNLNIGVALLSEVRHVAARVVRYRLHPNQVSADDNLRLRQEARLYQKWSTRRDVSPDHAHRVAVAERFRIGPLAVRLALIHGKRALRERRLKDALKATRDLGRGLGNWVRKGR